MTKQYTILALFSFLSLVNSTRTIAQTSIDWQKTIGTSFYDEALKIFNDEDGNIVVLGTETHEDFTGTLRTYMVSMKLDVDGNEIWKKYHDVAFETFNPPVNYYIGKHFYTVESGQKYINLVVNLAGNNLLYRLDDATGEFAFFDYIPSTSLAITRDNVRTYASTTCSWQQSCYGPDSLIVQQLNPVADSLFNFIEWTFELKQNIRTATIDGHYDFNVNDITMDALGNVYLLLQIERWDFNHCTDCNDIFIDAYSMIYKFNPQGEEVKHIRLNTTTAVVSHMGFLDVDDDHIVIRVNDINNQGTAVITTIFHLDSNLNVQEEFDLDKSYHHLIVDENENLYGIVNVYDENDPNIKGASDVQVVKFNVEGELQWRSYYGGTSFDFPKGMALTNDGGIVFMANTESEDFDIAESFGWQDIWLVKLSESSTGVGEEHETEISVYPNPASSFVQITSADGMDMIRIVDMLGKVVVNESITSEDEKISVSHLPVGTYFVEVSGQGNKVAVSKLVKI